MYPISGYIRARQITEYPIIGYPAFGFSLRGNPALDLVTTAEESAAKKLIGRRIKAAMARKDLTQVALGRLVGRRQNVVSDWLTGQRRLGFSDAWQLARALGVPLETLIGPPATAAEKNQFAADVRAYRAFESTR